MIRCKEKIDKIRESNLAAETEMKNLQRKQLYELVDELRSMRQDCIDAADTLDALRESKIDFTQVKEILERHNLYYARVLPSDNPNRYFYSFKNCEVRVYYYFDKNDVNFGWSAHGMGEMLSFAEDSKDYILKNVFGGKYEGCLEMLIVNIRTSLKELFDFVDKL